MENKEALNKKRIGGEETGNYPIDMGDYNIELYFVDNDGDPVEDGYMTMEAFESERKFFEAICKVSLPMINDLFNNEDAPENEQCYSWLREKTWSMKNGRLTLELHLV